MGSVLKVGWANFFEKSVDGPGASVIVFDTEDEAKECWPRGRPGGPKRVAVSRFNDEEDPPAAPEGTAG